MITYPAIFKATNGDEIYYTCVFCQGDILITWDNYILGHILTQKNAAEISCNHCEHKYYLRRPTPLDIIQDERKLRIAGGVCYELSR